MAKITGDLKLGKYEIHEVFFQDERQMQKKNFDHRKGEKNDASNSEE